MVRYVWYVFIFGSLCFSSLEMSGQNVVLSTLGGDLYEFDGATCSTRFITKVPTALYDISFHPNGKFYGINGTGGLYEIDLQTGISRLVHLFTQAPDDFINSFTIDLDGTCYVMGPPGYLQSYNIGTQEEIFYGQYEFGATGDLSFYNGDLYAAVAGDRIMKMDLNNPSASSVVVNESLEGTIWGIVSFDKDCGDINTYVVTNDRNAIYELDFDRSRFLKLCDLDIEPSGGASKFEFISSREIEILQEEIVNPTCNQADGSFLIEASYPLGDINYSLNGINSDNGFWSELASNEYEVVITAGEFCIYKDQINLNANDVQFEVRNINRPDCGEDNGSFEIAINNGSPPFEIFVNQSFLEENALFDLPSDNYTITITDSLGCEETSSFYLASLRCPFDIPNIFSPNGDNTNDGFQIRLHPDFNGSIVQFKIFDRWGNQVHTNEDPNAFSVWDGTFNGNLASEGVYSYILQVLYEDGFLETKVGNLTLVR